MKLFLDKILAKKVSLILVSNTELKLEWATDLKKIKIQKLDKFETEILAYNILNIKDKG